MFVVVGGRDMSQSSPSGALLCHATGVLGDPQDVDTELPCSLVDMANILQFFPILKISLSSSQQHQAVSTN